MKGNDVKLIAKLKIFIWSSSPGSLPIFRTRARSPSVISASTLTPTGGSDARKHKNATNS
ncbi:MAG: hypothetical protein PVI11_07450 [Candidatus Aminicenantes bacterium]